jgi:hypothetical protein
MEDFFGKPLSQIDSDDILSLMDTPEGQVFEIKSRLSADKKDPWYADPESGKIRNSPGDHAKQDIFKELVAFANSEGGWLVIGLTESADKPKRVSGIAPLPDCHELAERLNRAAYEWIDPPLPSLQCRGIEMGDKPGEGVVVFRVPRSPNAPHRVYKKDRAYEAYKRVSDESKPIRMREIQDMTLDIARGQERIEREFNDARKRFLITKPNPSPRNQLIGFNITLICLSGPLAVDRIYLQPALFERRYSIGENFHIVNGVTFFIHTIDAHPNRLSDQVRPILRGGRNTWSAKFDSLRPGQPPREDQSFITLDVFESGTVQLFAKTTYTYPPRIDIRWILADLFNALCVTERLRKVGGMPDAEYAMEIELGFDASSGERTFKFSEERFALRLLPKDNYPQDSDTAHILLPRYPVASTNNFSKIIKRVMDDIYNSVEEPHIENFQFPHIC